MTKKLKIGDFVEILGCTPCRYKPGTVGIVVGVNEDGVFVVAPLDIKCSNDATVWHYDYKNVKHLSRWIRVI